MAPATDYDRLVAELGDLPEMAEKGCVDRLFGGVVEVGRRTQGAKDF
jgi:hypothetical protein